MKKMPNTKRVDTSLFQDEHYLGKPAEAQDKIVQRRINLVSSFVNFIRNDKTLLDVGCGNGASLFLIADKMKECLGIDIHDKYAKEFQKLKKEKELANCEFRVLNIETETLAQQYDRIISFEVIEHLSSEQSVEFYFNTLKPGGLAAISVPNKWWIFETHGANLPLLPWNRVPLFSWLPKCIHEKFANARIYTKRRITHLLTLHGFKILKIYYVTAPMDVLKEGKLKRILLGTVFKNDSTKIPFLATSILLLVQKPAGIKRH
ncbi:methyltransferase domain-containing protein [candidate division KSB1 bacterium]|nr:methyltransferase domain-containing protein [candidate division KSB1 bacterium]